MKIDKTALAVTLTVAALAFAAAAPPVAAQTEEKKPAFGITLSGFVKTDIFYDTRQTVAVREGHYLLFPKAPQIGPDGDDVNDRAGFHMLSIQTRIAGKIT